MRLRTARLFLILVLGVLLAPLAADAQQAEKVYLVGLSQTDRPQCPPAHDGPGHEEEAP